MNAAFSCPDHFGSRHRDPSPHPDEHGNGPEAAPSRPYAARTYRRPGSRLPSPSTPGCALASWPHTIPSGWNAHPACGGRLSKMSQPGRGLRTPARGLPAGRAGPGHDRPRPGTLDPCRPAARQAAPLRRWPPSARRREGGSALPHLQAARPGGHSRQAVLGHLCLQHH
jgi:hypothetical protein